MVRRQLVASRSLARDVIQAGRVTVAGAPVFKPARLVDPGDPIVVAGEPRPFVSRGGQKLAAALDGFAIEVAGHRVIDCGASTGGFTDCLLQRGAAEVVAVDVGRGQLHHSLIVDERVRNVERTNVRYVTPHDLGGTVPLVVADLSFISLETVMPALIALVAPGGSLVALVKPQFEVGRSVASRGRGVIRDPESWRSVLSTVQNAANAAGAVMMEVMTSPLTGADGNVEFLARFVPLEDARCPPLTVAEIDAVVRRAEELHS